VQRLALVGCCLSTLAACAPCSLDGCVGGLRFTAHRENAQPLEVAAYQLEIELENTRYGATCSLFPTILIDGARRCTEPEVVEGEAEFSVTVAPWFGGDVVEDVDSSLPPLGVRVEAHQDVDEGELGSLRGPSSARIILTRDEVIVVDTSLQLDYERRDDAHGGDRCGYCDDLQERTATF
jgi:hypothetical protein